MAGDQTTFKPRRIGKDARTVLPAKTLTHAHRTDKIIIIIIMNRIAIIIGTQITTTKNKSRFGRKIFYVTAVGDEEMSSSVGESIANNNT